MTGGLTVAVAAVFLAGPRVDTAYHPRNPDLPADLDAYLVRSESRYPDLTPGAEKTIVWAGPAGTRTPLAIVYLHGFSATRQETAPLCDRVAAHFGANLYYARLSGHGRGGAALADATVDDWLNDASEALQIGHRIGEHVVVIGTSTGGTLAAWLARQFPDAIDASGLISPNFGPRNRRAWFLTWPWARQLAPISFGAWRRKTPGSVAEARYWTLDYPTIALIPMMGLVQLVRHSPLEEIRSPTLVIYSLEDRTVDPRETERAFVRLGASRKKLVPFADRVTASHHVLAGTILAPANTDRMADIIIDFIDGLPLDDGVRSGR